MTAALRVRLSGQGSDIYAAVAVALTVGVTVLLSGIGRVDP